MATMEVRGKVADGDGRKTRVCHVRFSQLSPGHGCLHRWQLRPCRSTFTHTTIVEFNALLSLAIYLFITFKLLSSSAVHRQLSDLTGQIKLVCWRPPDCSAALPPSSKSPGCLDNFI